MSIDMLQEKIRKLKNPSVVELMLPLVSPPKKSSMKNWMSMLSRARAWARQITGLPAAW